MLTALHIHHLRNLSALQLNPSGAFNVIYGPNGSGKTSILEAIYLLSFGRSFRTHLISRIIQNYQESFTLFGQIKPKEMAIPIGMVRHRNGDCQLRLAEESPASIIELAKALPVQVIHPDSHRLLTDGPKLRRQLLNWGMFHVEHSFYSIWQRTLRSIKQRNAAIKKNQSKQKVKLWDREFIQNAMILDQQRHQYFNQLKPLFEQLIQTLLPQIPITCNYYPGWNAVLGLETVLEQSIDRDIELGHTQFGPQRADIKIEINTIPVQDALSQGQQKLIIYGLRLAQGQLHQQMKQCSPIYLIDDLPAELDLHKRQIVTKLLVSLKSQVFITGAEQAEMQDLIQPDTQMFYVEHGQLITEKMT